MAALLLSMVTLTATVTATLSTAARLREFAVFYQGLNAQEIHARSCGEHQALINNFRDAMNALQSLSPSTPIALELHNAGWPLPTDPAIQTLVECQNKVEIVPRDKPAVMWISVPHRQNNQEIAEGLPNWVARWQREFPR